MARQRSVGVIASGVIAILGSLATILMGFSMFLAWIAMRSNPEAFRPPGNVPYPAIDLAVFALVEGVFFLALGVFGIVCAVALLRLKNWARVSFLVFGGLLALFSIFGVFGIVVAMFVMRQMAVPPELPQSFMTIMFVIFLAITLMLTAVGIWWLVLFTRPRVRVQFLGEAKAALPRRGPLSITIIAWILVVGGVLTTSLGLFWSYPVMFFGVVAQGWSARLLMAAWGALSLIAGVGMLRWRRAAWTVAVGLYAMGLLNQIANVLVPGSIAKMQALMQQTTANSGMVLDINATFWAGMVAGMVATCVLLWLLVTRRQAFLEAAKSPVSASVQS